MVMDRETGQSRGFGFVTFTTAAAAADAVKALDQQLFNVRPTAAAASETKKNRKPQKSSNSMDRPSIESSTTRQHAAPHYAPT